MNRQGSEFRGHGAWGMGHGSRKVLMLVLLGVLLFACFNVDSQEPIIGAGSPVTDNWLSLHECVKIAVRNSFEVKKAKLDLYISETDLMYSEAVFDTILYGGVSYNEDKSQQLSVFSADDSQTNTYYAGFTKKLPTGTELTTEVGDTRFWNNTAFVSKNPSHEAQLSLEAKQPIGNNIFGYTDKAAVSLTKLAIKNADLDTKDRIEAFIATVEKSYFEFISAREELEIYRDMLEKTKKLYETDKKNFDLGLAEKVDVLASEARVASVEAELFIAENDYNRAEADLKLLMNTRGNAEIIPTEKLFAERDSRDLAEYLKIAFAQRRDYLIAKRDIEIKGLDLKVKDNAKYPKIDLTLSMEMNGLEGDITKSAGKIVVADNTNYYAGIAFEMPLENSEARSAYKKAKYEKIKALTTLKEIERTIITEVGNAYGDLEALAVSIEYSKIAVELNKKKLEEEEKRFVHGRSSTKQIIDYQRDLLQAELEHTQYLLRYNSSKVVLERFVNNTLKTYEDII